MGPTEIYGVSVSVPKEYMESLMDAIDSVLEPVYPGYRRCFYYFPVKGTWKTEEGAHPFDGTPGEITVADEMVLKFVCRKENLKAVLSQIDKVHPYEEPAVDVIPQVGWRSFLSSSP